MADRPGGWRASSRLLWIIDRVRSGSMRLGRGAVLAGLDRWAFMEAMDERGVRAVLALS